MSITPPAPARPTLKVLLVDDDEVDRLAIRRLLDKLDQLAFEIDEASDLATATVSLNYARYDCVLLDFRLPDGDGFALLHHLDAAHGAGPPVIILTGLDDAELAVQTIANGAQDYLVKGSFSAEQLLHVVQCAVERDHLIKRQRVFRF
jgi:DNA-binding response OmpR family regulator